MVRGAKARSLGPNDSPQINDFGKFCLTIVHGKLGKFFFSNEPPVKATIPHIFWPQEVPR
jgi:hypothetical protein